MTEEAKKGFKEESENYVSPWTAKKLLKNKSYGASHAHMVS